MFSSITLLKVNSNYFYQILHAMLQGLTYIAAQSTLAAFYVLFFSSDVGTQRLYTLRILRVCGYCHWLCYVFVVYTDAAAIAKSKSKSLHFARM